MCKWQCYLPSILLNMVLSHFVAIFTSNIDFTFLIHYVQPRAGLAFKHSLSQCLLWQLLDVRSLQMGLAMFAYTEDGVITNYLLFFLFLTCHSRLLLCLKPSLHVLFVPSSLKTYWFGSSWAKVAIDSLEGRSGMFTIATMPTRDICCITYF